jgi:hypothetical protein
MGGIFCEIVSRNGKSLFESRYIAGKCQILLCVKTSYCRRRNSVVLCWAEAQNPLKFNSHLYWFYETVDRCFVLFLSNK